MSTVKETAKLWTMVLLLGAVIVALAGCSGEKEQLQGQAETPPATQETGGETPKAAPPEPATIKFFSDIAMSPDEIQQLIVEPLRKKLPHITLQVMEKLDTPLESQLAAGVAPDVVYTKADALSRYIDLDMHYDMSELMKQRSMSVDRFNSGALDAVRIWSPGNEWFALPYTVNFRALYYSKELFDRFGVTYPKDGMVWEDVIDVARLMSREAGGIQYMGLSVININTFVSPMSLPMVDAKTEQAAVYSDGWQKVFALAKTIYEIPGNLYDRKFYNQNGADGAFMKDKILAMYAAKTLLEQLDPKYVGDFQWDLTQYPSYREKLNVYGSDVTQVLLLSSASKQKEAAFDVIAALVSDEAQLLASRIGKMSPLNDAAIQTAFASELSYLKGKNVQSLFKSSPAKPPVATPYDDASRRQVNQHFNGMIQNKEDVNTTLRKLEEAINKEVAQMKVK